MVGPRIVLQLYRAKKAMDTIEAGKIDGHRVSIGLPPMTNWSEECCGDCCGMVQLACMKCWCPCCVPDYTPKCRGCPNLCVPNTYLNDVVKNVIGFLSGLFLSYLWYLLMVFQLEYHPYVAANTCAIVAVVLSFGLAFSHSCRCMVLLTLPGMCSSKGRTLLVGFMFLLVMSYPVQNFQHNVHVASQSALCGQEMMYNATKNILEEAVSPVKSMIGKFREMIEDLKKFAYKLRDIFRKVKELFSEILDAIRSAFRWLGSMVDICNDKMGEPYQKCKKAFEDGYRDCKKSAGIFGFVCKIVTLVKNVCHVARIGELLCTLPSKIKGAIIGFIEEKLGFTIKSAKDLFYFNVTLVYKFDVTFTMSRSFDDVRRDIMAEVDERLRPLRMFTGWNHLSLVFMMLWMVYRAYSYKQRYLSRDRYDNCYISQDFLKIDEKRQTLRRETALPLVLNETSRYIYTKSILLTNKERRKLVKGTLLLLVTGVHAAFYMLMDSGLYSILTLVRQFNTFDISHYVPGYIKMHVQGDSYLADVYRAILSRFDPVGEDDSDIDFMVCLPNPNPPDFHMYKVIAFIYVLCIILVVTQAYCLRLRHVVCAFYYPERERKRAAWLYIRILRRRGGLAKLLRRRMRRHHRAVQEDTSTWAQRLGAHFPIVAKILKALGYEQKYCLSCGQSGPKDDMNAFTHCCNHDCNAVYCRACFADLGKICTVCMRPVDYGDLSDMSEERDSSDEEPVVTTVEEPARGVVRGSVNTLLRRFRDRELDFSYQNQQ